MRYNVDINTVGNYSKFGGYLARFYVISLDDKISYLLILIFCCILCMIQLETHADTTIISNGKKLICIKGISAYSPNSVQIGTIDMNYMRTFSELIYIKITIEDLLQKKYKCFTNVNEKSETKTTTPMYTIEIHDIENKLKYEELCNKFLEFIKTKVLSYTTIKNKIGIYLLKLERIITETEIPNSEYESWLEKKKYLEDNKDKVQIDISKIDIPSKTIKKVVEKKELKCNKITDIWKDISTLYLRETDMIKLIKLLEQYKNHPEIYKEYGIPRKLGFLFHGLPGTGKSTTIRVIATMLQKDIYYVNLKNVCTNQDLQNIFDYVTKQKIENGGGIIVFEDIDCMTSMVKSRESETNTTLTSALEESDDRLSLSYFLNLLDGSLCGDENVFIMTTNYKNRLDPALYRPSRVNLDIEFKLCDHYQVRNMYSVIMKRKIDETVLARIPEDKFMPSLVIEHLVLNCCNKDPDEIIMKTFIN